MRLFYKNAKMEHNVTVNIIVYIVSFILSLTRNVENNSRAEANKFSDYAYFSKPVN
jgi:hypothetical protein